MTFLTPLFLFALAAVSVPVIIHFLNFKKPKKVAFSTLAFFQELQKSTIRRMKIKRWLLLAIRSAVIIFLALALSRPFLNPSANFLAGGGPVLYGIVLENGIGMNRIDANGPYMNQARSLANAVIDRAREQDRFLVYNTHGELLRSSVLDAGQARRLLEEIEPQPKGNFLPQRLHGIKEALANWQGSGKVIFWFTSASPGLGDSIEGIEYDRDIPVNVIRVGNARLPNTAVREVRAVSGISGVSRPVTLQVEVQNLGNEAVFNHFVSLETSDGLVGQYQADLNAGESGRYLFEVIPSKIGSFTGKVTLEGDAFPLDNTYYFSLFVPETRSVLLISEEGSGTYLQRVLEAGRDVHSQISLDIQTLSQALNISSFDQYDAVVLDGIVRIPESLEEQLQRFVQAGNGLIFYPSERGSISSYNRFLSRFNAGQINGLVGQYGSFNAVTSLNQLVEGHPVLDNIFEQSENRKINVTLPSIYYYFRYDAAGASAAFTIMRSALNDPLLIEHTYGNGRVLISMIGSDPGWSAMPGSPLFAPINYRTVLFASSVDAGAALVHKLGNSFSETLQVRGPLVEIRNQEDSFRAEVNPLGSGASLVEYPATEWVPGIYTISDEDRQTAVAVNLDISESDFRSLSKSELENILKNHLYLSGVFDAGERSPELVQSDIESAGFGTEIWYFFIILAFLLLVAESVVSRIYKAETVA